MAWGRYESSFVKHPKVQAIPRAQRSDAIALHVASTLYCAELLTDGFVPTGVIPRLAAEVGVRGHKTLVTVLKNVGLFDAVEGGIRVHDYLIYNPTASEVKDKRRQAAERQARHRSQTKLDVTPNVTRDVTPNVTRDSLARADAPAHARARPVPSQEPLQGDWDGEGPEPPTPLEAPPALRVVVDPDPELTETEREENAKRARELVERVTPPPPSEEPTAEEIAERERRSAASRARLAHDQADTDADIPLR